MQQNILKLTILYIIVLSGIFTGNLNAQNMTVIGVEPNPLLSSTLNGEGVYSFQFENAIGEIPVESSPGIPSTQLSLTFNRVTMKDDDVSNLSGTLMDYFSAYFVDNASGGTVTLLQNRVIPFNVVLRLDIPVDVIADTSSASPGNTVSASWQTTYFTPYSPTPRILITTHTTLSPTLVDDTATTNVDSAIVIDVLSNDSNVVNTGTFSVSQPSSGSVAINDGGTPNDPSDDSVTYTPNSGFSGTDDFTYTICNIDNNNCDTATVTVTVSAAGAMLNVVDDMVSTNEGVAIVVDVLNNDTGVDPTTVSITTNPNSGMVSVNPITGQVTYTPNANFDGTDTFEYQVCDNNNPVNCNTATVTVNVIDMQIDSDKDGVLDQSDFDDDNDGILDLQEMDCAANQADFITYNGTNLVSQTYNTNLEGLTITSSIITDPERPGDIISRTNNEIRGTNLGRIQTIEFNRPVYNLNFDIRDFDYDAALQYEQVKVEFYYQGQQVQPTNILLGTQTVVAAREGFYRGTTSQSNPNGLSLSVTYDLNGELVDEIKIYHDIIGTIIAAIYYNFNSGCVDIDTDGDEIPNRLDLDSDGDGCPDAVEGSGNFTLGDLEESDMPGGNTGGNYTGSSTDPVDTNLGNTVVTDVLSPLYGVPTIAGTGQAIDSSQDGAVNYCAIIDPCNPVSPDFIDTDNDGVGDACDLDDDNDGVLDVIENNGVDQFTDSNSNGIPDYRDSTIAAFVDSNNDGIDDNLDPDLDGIINLLDLDSDGDLIPDNIEAQTTQGYRKPTGVVNDSGVDNAYAAINIITPVNTDGVDEIDMLDTDTDNDGMLDIDESGFTTTNTDVDNDGLDDSVDSDLTGYGDPSGLVYDDVNDNLNLLNTDPANQIDFNYREASIDLCDPLNPLFVDTDGDGIGDACDLDDDNDGILDTEEGYTAQHQRFSPDNATTTSTDFGAGRPLSNTYDNNLSTFGGTNDGVSTITGDVSYFFTTPKDIAEMQIYPNGGNVLGDAQLSLIGTITVYNSAGVLYTTSNIVVPQANHPTGDPFIFEFPSLLTDVTEVRFTNLTDNAHTPAACLWREVYFSASTTVSVDADNDGIPNHLDLDSDNDGCPDALEGASSNFTYADLNPNGSINTATYPVDNVSSSATYGSPNSTNNLMGSSQNAAVQSRECNSCDADSSLFVDSDGDSIGDDCDLDDDNDGILDTNEQGACASGASSRTGTWTGGTTNGTISLDRNSTTTSDVNVTIAVTTTAPAQITEFATGNFGTTTNFWHETLTGEPSFEAKFWWDVTPDNRFTNISNYRDDQGSGVITITFSKPVVNPVLNIDRIGGRLGVAPYTTNSIQLRLITPRISLERLTGTDDFEVTETTIQRTPHAVGGGGSLESGQTAATGTAAGSVRLNGIFTSVQFEYKGVGVEALGEDEIEFIISNVCPETDTDGDGIPNRLDLDSDDDGCPDALEGDAPNSEIGYSQLDTDTSLLGAVDGDGVPTVTGSRQGIGTSQDASLQADECSPCDVNNPKYVDSDGDNIGDACDLDDDNDGILDVEEGVATFIGRPNSLGDNLVTNNGVVNYPSSNNSQNVIINQSFTGSPVADRGGLRFSQRDNDGSLIMDFTQNSGGVANGIIFTVADLDYADESAIIRVYVNDVLLEDITQYATFYYADHLSTSTYPGTSFIPVDNYLSSPVGMSALWDHDGLPDYSDGGNASPSLNDSSVVFDLSTIQNITRLEIDFPKLAPTSTKAAANWFFLEQLTVDTDTDGDGIPNRLDLDSDNDSCPDALEGDAPNSEIGYSQLDADTSLLGAVDGDGVPTVTGSRQGVGTSQDASLQSDECSPCDVNNPEYVDSDGDNIGDACDLDDDNDGILDCVENGVEVSHAFNIVGNASRTTATEFELTPNSRNQSGTAMSFGKIDFSSNFELSFEAYLGANEGGADGMAIIFHNDPAGENALGSLGAGLGAEGIQDGIVLELDTYRNSGGTAYTQDIADDHGMIWDSDNQRNEGLLTPAVSLGQLEDNNWHRVTISWDASTNTISYYVGTILAGTFTGDLITNYFGGSNTVHLGFTAGTGRASNTHKVRFDDLCALPLALDTDGDGIPNRLDLDSDGDGCPDAIEGDGGFTLDDLVESTTMDGENLGNTVETDILSPSYGVPITAGTGQLAGSSQDVLVQAENCNPVCYKPGIAGSSLPSVSGISTLDRTMVETSEWDNMPGNGFLVLESKEKGFVITRIEGFKDQTDSTPTISSPVEGMLIFDVDADCLKMYADGEWFCLEQTCID